MGKDKTGGEEMRKIILTLCITGIITTGLLFAQGKNGVTQTAQAESTPAVAVSTAAADSGAATVESKTIKTEVQSPGVVTEYKEDGTKVVTINLSEVDENKLPEKYEAKIILEAPVYSAPSGNGELMYDGKVIVKEDNKGIMRLGGKSFSPDGTFLMSSTTDGYPGEFDVKVDESGNIYILDMLNSRIQKFNSNGKHIKNIILNNVYTSRYDKIRGQTLLDNSKDEIAVLKGDVYVRDSVKNKIEKLDESGKVLETINIPEVIDGESTRGMKEWADKEGVIATRNKAKIEKRSIRVSGILLKRGDIKYDSLNSNNVISLNEKNKIVVLNNALNLLLKSNEKIFGIYLISQNEKFLYFSITGNGFYNGIFKFNSEGNLVSRIQDWKCWFSKEWSGACEIPSGGIRGLANGGILSNTLMDNRNNIYLFQLVCCENDNCLSKIRIIKISTVKGK